MTETNSRNQRLHILLADDDQDDRFFFREALKGLTFETSFTSVSNGEELLTFLSENPDQLPDVLFLDMNMPRINGSECLAEIKRNGRLQHIPVIIYSTALYEELAFALFQSGAHYYFKKCDLDLLRKGIIHVISLLKDNPGRPLWENFICNPTEKGVRQSMS